MKRNRTAYLRQWRLDNPEKSRQLGRVSGERRRRINPEACRESVRQARANKPEKYRKMGRESVSRWRARHPEQEKTNAALRRSGRRVLLDKVKSKPCADCRIQYHPVVMDFDHRPGTIKSFNISMSWGRSLDVLLAEIAKCDIVCSNCHRLRTGARRADTNARMV
jgi:hypothetical protein